MRVRQVELQGHNGHTMTVWVDAELPLKPGVVVTGKDGRIWRVTAAYKTIMDSEQLNRDWRVGGLM